MQKTKNITIIICIIFSALTFIVVGFLFGKKYSSSEQLYQGAFFPNRKEDNQNLSGQEQVSNSYSNPEEILATESEVKQKNSKCWNDFDINKLDYSQPIWESELPDMISTFAFMQASESGNRELCNSLIRGGTELDEARQDCLLRFDLLSNRGLIGRFVAGINLDEYVSQCVNILNADPSFIEDNPNLNERKVFAESICRGYYTSYNNKSVYIDRPEDMCDGSEKSDVCDYVGVNGQTHSCRSSACKYIKYIVAVAKDRQSECSDIKNLDFSTICNFYFDKSYKENYQKKIKEAYCRNEMSLSYPVENKNIQSDENTQEVEGAQEGDETQKNLE